MEIKIITNGDQHIVDVSFKNYERKMKTIKAVKMHDVFRATGDDGRTVFGAAGDYLVANEDGSLQAMPDWKLDAEYKIIK